MSDYLAHYGRKGMKWGKNIFKPDDEVKYHESGTVSVKYPNHDETLLLKDQGSDYKNRLAAVRAYSKAHPDKASQMKRNALIPNYSEDKNGVLSSQRHAWSQARLKKTGQKAYASWVDSRRQALISDVRKGKTYNRGRELLRLHMYGTAVSEI